MSYEWPNTVPFCNLTTFETTRLPNTITEEPTVGGEEIRVIATRSLRKWEQMRLANLSLSEIDAFWSWWETTLSFGSEPFLINEPERQLSNPRPTLVQFSGTPRQSRDGPKTYSLTFSMVEK